MLKFFVSHLSINFYTFPSPKTTTGTASLHCFWGLQCRFMSGAAPHTRALWLFFTMALLGEIKRLAAATAAKQINLTTITVWRPPIDAKSRRHGTDHARESGGKICIHSCSNMFLIHATLDPPFWTSLLKEVPSSLLLFCLVAQKKPMSSLGKW